MSKVLFMFDSITLNLPSEPAAVAGYVDGHWPDYAEMVSRYPNALHVSVTVSASRDARILDVESGDATADQAPAWMERQLARGEKLPGVYASVSNMQAVINHLTSAGIARHRYVVWTADATNSPHINGPGSYPGFDSQADATQYTFHADGRNLDESECDESFFAALVKEPTGQANFAGFVDFSTRRWTLHPQPGHIALGSEDRWWSAKVKIHETTGEWKIEALEFETS